MKSTVVVLCVFLFSFSHLLCMKNKLTKKTKNDEIPLMKNSIQTDTEKNLKTAQRKFIQSIDPEDPREREISCCGCYYPVHRNAREDKIARANCAGGFLIGCSFGFSAGLIILLNVIFTVAGKMS